MFIKCYFNVGKDTNIAVFFPRFTTNFKINFEQFLRVLRYATEASALTLLKFDDGSILSRVSPRAR